MTEYQPDDVDRQLLGLLQENARYTALELADRVGVSDNTVHNRMEKLEEAGVITGYAATVDHDRVGIDRSFIFTCTARISERADAAAEILDIPEVVEVTERMTGERNLLVKAFGAEDEDISAVAEQVEQLDVEINDENRIRAVHTRPLDYLDVRATPDEE